MTHGVGGIRQGSDAVGLRMAVKTLSKYGILQWPVFDEDHFEVREKIPFIIDGFEPAGNAFTDFNLNDEPYVFISYAQRDPTSANEAATYLRAHGIRFWRDTEPLNGRYDIEIERRLREAKCVLVLWTRDALASDWVPGEAQRGRESRRLVQLLCNVSRDELPPDFVRIQSYDLTDRERWLTSVRQMLTA
jgi:hypothetical protein